MNALLRLLPALALVPFAAAQSLPTPGSGEGKPKPLGGEWEVRYTDDSTMRVSLLDEHVTLVTSYGPLHIPFREIKRIEFGQRLTDADQAKVDQAVADVLGKDAGKRVKGKQALADLGAKALPHVRRAQRTADDDAIPHLAEVAARLQALLPNPKAEPHDYDVVVTDDSKIAGRVQAPSLRIQTWQFGELKLRVTDCAALTQGRGADPDEKLEIVEGRSVYQLLQTHMGKTVGIRTTGAIQGAVWGSGPFTGDSDLATAAVFAGALKVGQAGVVKVRIVPSPPQFFGGSANGVQTSNYGQFPAGAYEIIVK